MVSFLKKSVITRKSEARRGSLRQTSAHWEGKMATGGHRGSGTRLSARLGVVRSWLVQSWGELLKVVMWILDRDMLSTEGYPRILTSASMTDSN